VLLLRSGSTSPVYSRDGAGNVRQRTWIIPGA